MIINDIYYHIEISGAGHPLVLLHGFTGSTKSWDYHAIVLSKHFQVIRIDLLGHGKTDVPQSPSRYNMENTASDLNSIFEQLDLSSIFLLGYSMGGRLALYTALQFPQYIHTLILESASPGLKTQIERNQRIIKDEALAKQIIDGGIGAFVRYWETLPLWDSQQSLSHTIRETLHHQRLQNNPNGLANSLIGMGTGAQPSLWEKLGNIQVSVHLIVGELDAKFVSIAQDMHGQLLNSHLHIVDAAGHTVHLEQPEAFNEILLNNLSHVST